MINYNLIYCSHSNSYTSQNEPIIYSSISIILNILSIDHLMVTFFFPTINENEDFYRDFNYLETGNYFCDFLSFSVSELTFWFWSI
jgi:hypothetical protein